MPKLTLVFVGEKDDEQYLDYQEATWQPILDAHPTPTLEDLADFCDQNAESANNHSFVGTHRILAALLHLILGREQATHILKEIAEYSGLDGMTGDGGKDDAFKDFGIEEPWHDWKLPD